MPETSMVSGKDGPKGSVIKVTVTLLLRSMSDDVVMETMAENGAEVNSFIGRGRSLHINGVTVLWRECSGYHEIGGGTRRTANFSIMSFINGVMGAQLLMIHRLIKVMDIFGGSAITQ
jgi:hypothetical protein